MNIYYLTKGISFYLTVFTVERETAQLYFVDNGQLLTGGPGAYARRLKKDDPNVFTDRNAALAAYRTGLERAITDYERWIVNFRQQLADVDALRPPVTEQGESR